MTLEYNGQRIGAMQYNGVTIGEAMMDGQIVYRSIHPMFQLMPDHWYSMEDGAHWFDRGSAKEDLYFSSGSFANRGDHAFGSDGTSRVDVPSTWLNGFTMSGWFQITGGHGNTHYFFSRRGGSGADYRYMDIWIPGGAGRGDTLGIRAGDNGDSVSLISQPGVIPLGEWFHLAVTCANDNPQIVKAYVNGQLAHEFYLESTYPWPLKFVERAPFSVGGNASSNYVFFDGNIDDVALWSRPLTAAEVGSIHGAGPVPTSSLEAPPAYEEVIQRFTVAGSHSVSVPEWCKFIDVILLGGGAGGAAGNGGNNGNGYGGGAGLYAHGTVKRPEGFSVSVRVGAGGGGSYQNGVGNHANGGNSTLYIGGNSVLAAGGGIRNQSSNRRGLEPGNRSFAGGTITGGIGASGGGFSGSGAPPGGTSTPPGAGGPGGTGGIFGLYQHGGAGARGEVWMRMRSGPRP